MSVLLTEAEIAERLRCSLQKVRRLRLAGRLAYLPGRPPMVDEADFLAFIEEEKRTAAKHAARKQRAIQAEKDRVLAEIRDRAKQAWLQRNLRKEKKGRG